MEYCSDTCLISCRITAISSLQTPTQYAHHRRLREPMLINDARSGGTQTMHAITKIIFLSKIYKNCNKGQRWRSSATKFNQIYDSL